MLHPRAARRPLKPVHLNRELQWWQEPNITHLLQNTGHLRRRPSQAKQIRGKAQPSQANKGYHRAYSIALPPKGGVGQGNSKAPPNNQPCINCNKTGHWARECPYPKKNNQKPTTANARPRYVHYTTMEEIPSSEVVTAGMFLVNHHPAVVLFDSGALHPSMIRK